MLNKYINKQNVILLCLLFLTVGKLLLSSTLPVLCLSGRIYDEELMTNQANSLINNEYLGEYSEKTLIKGLIYPLFIYTLNFLHIPYLLGLSLLYIFSCILFCYVVRDLFKDKNYLYIIYLIMLFNPISFSRDSYLNMYRNSLGIISSLTFISMLYKLYLSKGKKLIIWSSLLGIIFSLIKFSREDNIWMIPSLLLIIILVIRKIKRKEILFLLPLVLIPFTFKIIISYQNYKYYKVFTDNEISNSNFTKFYINLMSIKNYDDYQRVDVTKDMIEKAMDVSPTFNKLRSNLDETYKNFAGNSYKEIDNAYIIWAIRSLVYDNNDFKDGKDANNYFGILSNDLEQAFKNGRLDKRLVIPSPFINHFTADDLLKTFINCFKTIKYTNSYKITINIGTTTTMASIVESVTGNKTISKLKFNGSRFTSEPYEKQINALNNITRFYQLFGFVFFIISFINYIYLLIKNKLSNTNVLLTIIIISYLTYISGVTFTDVTAFDTISSFYLTPVYTLQCAFVLISLLSMRVEDFYERFNNIISLLKRRGKYN